jgi:hypothetical protein
VIWDALQGLGVNLRDERVPGYKGRTLEPVGVLIHHTASGTKLDLPSLNICKYGRHDLPGPLCQILIGRANTVAVITDGYANHAGLGGHPSVGTDGNRRLIGVELENNGVGEPWPASQIATAAKVTGRLNERFGSVVLGHKEWTPRKVDPSFDMNGFRQTVISLRPQPVPPPPPSTSTEDDEMYFVKDDRPDWSIWHIYRHQDTGLLVRRLVNGDEWRVLAPRYEPLLVVRPWAEVEKIVVAPGL